MESKDLFQIVENGYSCEQVEKYISVLKAEYKKIFEYANVTKENNEKLKNICRSLSEENKSLKANGSVAAEADDSVVEVIEKISALCEELAKENAALHKLISK